MKRSEITVGSSKLIKPTNNTRSVCHVNSLPPHRRISNPSVPSGDEIDVLVTLIKNDQVKLGIEAPDDVGIVRDEL